MDNADDIILYVFHYIKTFVFESLEHDFLFIPCAIFFKFFSQMPVITSNLREVSNCFFLNNGPEIVQLKISVFKICSFPHHF